VQRQRIPEDQRIAGEVGPLEQHGANRRVVRVGDSVLCPGGCGSLDGLKVASVARFQPGDDLRRLKPLHHPHPAMGAHAVFHLRHDRQRLAGIAGPGQRADCLHAVRQGERQLVLESVIVPARFEDHQIAGRRLRRQRPRGSVDIHARLDHRVARQAEDRQQGRKQGARGGPDQPEAPAADQRQRGSQVGQRARRHQPDPQIGDQHEGEQPPARQHEVQPGQPGALREAGPERCQPVVARDSPAGQPPRAEQEQPAGQDELAPQQQLDHRAQRVERGLVAAGEIADPLADAVVAPVVLAQQHDQPGHEQDRGGNPGCRQP